METKETYYDRCYNLKYEVIKKIQELLDNKTVDLEEHNIYVTVIERHCGEVLSTSIDNISDDGFIAGGEEYRLSEMITDDLCVVLDKLNELL